MNKELLKEMVKGLEELGKNHSGELEVAFALYLRSSVEKIDNLSNEQLWQILDITNGLNNMLDDYYNEVDNILKDYSWC